MEIVQGEGCYWLVMRLSAHGAGRTEAAIDRIAGAADYLRMAPHLILQAWWSKTDAGVVSRPASEAEIAGLEARYGVALPTDFRQYLTEGAPVAENWDAENGNWWPLDRIKSIPEEYEHAVSAPIAENADKHLFFLDHMQWCWAWAISCVNDETFGRVALIGGQSEVYVASSFTDFVERYTTDWFEVSRLPKAEPKTVRIWDRLLRR